MEAAVGVETVGDGVVGAGQAEAGVSAEGVGCAVDLHDVLHLNGNGIKMKMGSLSPLRFK